MTERQFRAEFDARAEFSNGGHFNLEGSRVDVPSVKVAEAAVATLFVSSLGLLMTEKVDFNALRVFPEAHKGTRGGPSAAAGTSCALRRFVELSQVIHPGRVTFSGLLVHENAPKLTAAPPLFAQFGTFPVRAFAIV